MNREFLLENSKLSSMRWTLTRVTYMSEGLVLAIMFHIIYGTIKNTTIEWGGIALVLGGLTAYIGAALTGKWLQKKEEVKHEK